MFYPLGVSISICLTQIDSIAIFEWVNFYETSSELCARCSTSHTREDFPVVDFSYFSIGLPAAWSPCDNSATWHVSMPRVCVCEGPERVRNRRPPLHFISFNFSVVAFTTVPLMLRLHACQRRRFAHKILGKGFFGVVDILVGRPIKWAICWSYRS